MNWLDQYNSILNTEWAPISLNEKEENQFQQWFKSSELFQDFKKDIALENKIPIDKVDDNRLFEMLTSSPDYDYRQAWKANITGERSSFDNRIHLPSIAPTGEFLKSPTHPTMWKEFFMRENKVDPDELGLNTLDQAIQWQQNKPQQIIDLFANPFPSSIED